MYFHQDNIHSEAKKWVVIQRQVFMWKIIDTILVEKDFIDTKLDNGLFFGCGYIFSDFFVLRKFGSYAASIVPFIFIAGKNFAWKYHWRKGVGILNLLYKKHWQWLEEGPMRLYHQIKPARLIKGMD